jgi:hypothetical protein
MGCPVSIVDLTPTARKCLTAVPGRYGSGCLPAMGRQANAALSMSRALYEGAQLREDFLLRF